MNILVGWDDPAEAESIGVLLNVDDNFAKVVTNQQQFEQAATQGQWDVLVQALSFPDLGTSLELFNRIHRCNHDVPVIGVWRQNEIADLARFMSCGLHSHLMRDPEGSFILLLTSMASAAYCAAKSRRAAELARRLQDEVDSVRRLQESVIPRELPQPAGYQFAARYESSQIHVSGFVPVAMAGGDYYDVFPRDDKTLVLLVGDASGHGIKACMSIMTMHTLVRVVESQRHACTGNFMMEVNRRLCSNEIVHRGGGFITLLYSNLDLASHRLRWTSAGSPMPLLQNLETNVINPLGNEDQAGLPLAIDDNWVYHCFESELPKNSRMLIYTDGLEEAFPIDENGHDQFGVDGIVASLKSSVELPLPRALAKLFADSTDYTRGHGRLDDTSAMLVERKRDSVD